MLVVWWPVYLESVSSRLFHECVPCAAARQSMKNEQKSTPDAANKQGKVNAYPFWSPRFWHGMRAGAYCKLMLKNKCRVHPLRMPMAALLVPITCGNSAMHALQSLFFQRKIAATELTEPPIFILGHWRSGTTLLHELMIRDPRLSYSTTYECFAPDHFLISGAITPKLLWFLLPSKRPQDNMPAGFDRPQEDEFALISMGAPTPYMRMAFPNHPAPYEETLDMEGLSEIELREFKEAMSWFLKTLTYKKQKRLVLKSPPHTGRIGLLAEMFPGAKFIHLVRDPYALYSSAMRLWRAMDETQGFQIPRFDGLDEYVFETFTRMYEGFERGRATVDPQNVCDVRYEELAQDPIGLVESVYEKLDLGDFEVARPGIEAHVATLRDYKPNQHQLDEALMARIRERWAPYFERYGY